MARSGNRNRKRNQIVSRKRVQSRRNSRRNSQSRNRNARRTKRIRRRNIRGGCYPQPGPSNGQECTHKEYGVRHTRGDGMDQNGNLKRIRLICNKLGDKYEWEDMATAMKNFRLPNNEEKFKKKYIANLCNGSTVGH